MITIQQTIRLVCDNKDCDEQEIMTGFFPFPTTIKDILDVHRYEHRYSNWHLGKNGKLYCDDYCEESDG